MYAKQYGLKSLTHDETTVGIQLDVIIPELRLAFVFIKKGTEKEKSWIETVRYLCEARKIDLAVIQKAEANELCTAIKQGFTKAHLYVKSDNEKDIEILRKRYFALKNQRK